ncbi:MAG TPA: S-layer homology domain-containing protein [Clostridia bacterium]|nr:S-layer homology domain-containing protein [Clostridia bacterium]HRX42317.1 S-layer homology domain-containing protein [Clostridia bacterium]
MGKQVIKKNFSLLMAVIFMLSIYVVIPADAVSAYAYTFELEAASYSGYTAEASLEIAASGDPWKSQVVMFSLFDDSDVKVAEKRIYIPDGQDPDGTYEARFTDLEPASDYTVEASFYYYRSETQLNRQSDTAEVTTTAASGNPQFWLEIQRTGATEAVFQNEMFNTGIGVPVTELENPEVQADLFDAYGLIETSVVRRADHDPDELIYSGNPYYSGKIVSSYTKTRWTNTAENPFLYPQTLSGLEEDTDYVAQTVIIFTRNYVQYSSAPMGFSTYMKPDLSFESSTIGSTHAYIWCEVTLDPNDTLYNIQAAAQRRHTSDDPVAARVAIPYNPETKLVLFHLEGLVPGDMPLHTYDFTVTSLSLAGRHVIGTTFFDTRMTPVAPAVTTGTADNLRSDRARLNGTVTNDGYSNINEQGFVYSTVTGGNDHPEIDGAGVTKITSPVTTQNIPNDFSAYPNGLDAGTGYYYRAYVRNSFGVSYGDVLTFVTLSTPAVSTTGHENVDEDSALLTGNVSSTGGVSPTVRGFVVSRQSDPYLGGENVGLIIDDVSSEETGSFSTEASGLLSDSTYYYKAFILNAKGTFYGNQGSFVTDPLTGVPTVNLGIISVPQTNPAEKEVDATFGTPPGVNVTATGFVYSTGQNPVIGGSGVNNAALSDTDGEFETTLTGLSSSTTYYYRAYAITDEAVVSYSSQGMFTTPALPVTGYSVPVITSTELLEATSMTARIETVAVVSGPAHPNFIRRLCYSSTNSDPMPTDGDVTTVFAAFGGMTGDGAVITNINGLLGDTTYYLRAVTQNEQGTYYGSVISFTTDAAGIPIVTYPEPAVSDITETGAVLHAEVDYQGSQVYTYGVVYSDSSEDPLLGDGSSSVVEITDESSIIEDITIDLDGLVTSGRQYYYKVYVISGFTTSYGETNSFTTLTADLPVLVTGDTENSRNNAGIKMSVNSDGSGSAALESIGVVVGISADPEVTADGVFVSSMMFQSTGEKTFFVSGLEAGTMYYARAFGADISGSVHYGESVSFTTDEATEPVVETEGYAVAGDDFELYAMVSDDGGREVTERGFVYGTEASPKREEDTDIGCGSGTGSFEGLLEDFEEDTAYYVRAYAVNSIGTSYSGDMLVIVLSESDSASAPFAVTLMATDIESTSARLNGDITSDGNSTPVSRGFVISNEPGPDREDSNDQDYSGGTGTGTYHYDAEGLSPDTTYYVRAYAYNEEGLSYGDEVEFTTNQADGLSVQTNQAGTILYRSAVLAGEIEIRGSAILNSRGFVYGLGSNPSLGGTDFSVIVPGTDDGIYTVSVSGLSAGTVYYFRAYAFYEGSAEPVYGNAIRFSTLAYPVVIPGNSGNAVPEEGAIGYIDIPSGATGNGNVVQYTDSMGRKSIVGFGITDGNRMKYISRGPGEYEIVANSRLFDDIEGHWANGDILFTSARELFLGVETGMFAPESDMTRAMFVTVIGRLHGIDPADYTEVLFDDVVEGSYYAPYVQWAYQNGIVKGVTELLFEPERPVTREEIAVMVYRASALSGTDFSGAVPSYMDNEVISDWASDGVGFVQESGIMEGRPGNYFDPAEPAKRAEVAAILRRFIDYVLNNN